MSSILMSNTLDTHLCPNINQNERQNRSEFNESQSQVMIERILVILSENKLKPWLDFGLKAEYEKRYSRPLPEEWIAILMDCGRDVIEVEVMSYSNGTKTFIQLPIRKAKEQSAFTPRPILKPVVNTIPEPMEVQPLIEPLVYSTDNSVKEENEWIDKMVFNHLSDDMNGQNVLKAIKVSKDVISVAKCIPSPVLPSINRNPKSESDFFDVIVLSAKDPNHFVVIPFHNLNNESEFAQLKRRMNEVYDNEESPIELPTHEICLGVYIAGLSEKTWSRMQVKNIISKEPFKVFAYLCDYGDHKLIDLADIRPLYNCFRELPAQAMTASLATVKPIGDDYWDVYSSDEFRKMVANKPFVSTVCDIEQRDGHPVVCLSLCDTTREEDVYIGSDLVEKGIAKYKLPTI